MLILKVKYKMIIDRNNCLIKIIYLNHLSLSKVAIMTDEQVENYI